HFDNKADNQRLVCLEGGESTNSQGNKTCSRPFMMIQDLGSSLGGIQGRIPRRVDLDVWRSMAIWKDPDNCALNLPAGRYSKLKGDLVVSEEGRRLLADLLGQLSETQIRDLFLAARLHQQKPGWIIDQWVAVFKEKVQAISKHRCPSGLPEIPE